MSLNIKSFQYLGKRYEKLIVIGFKGIGKTLLLNYISRDYRFNEITISDDAWTKASLKLEMEKSHVLSSQVLEDFNGYLKNEYLILDLNTIIGFNKDLAYKQTTLRDLVKNINYTEITKPLYQLCNCGGKSELIKNGCKCGAVKPYIFK